MAWGPGVQNLPGREKKRLGEGRRSRTAAAKAVVRASKEKGRFRRVRRSHARLLAELFGHVETRRGPFQGPLQEDRWHSEATAVLSLGKTSDDQQDLVFTPPESSLSVTWASPLWGRVSRPGRRRYSEESQPSDVGVTCVTQAELSRGTWGN